MKTGFTFIEVLFALFIAGLMALTIGYTLILSLRSEERGRSMREALLVLSSHQAAAVMELEGEESVLGEHPGWRFSDEEIIIGRDDTQSVWRLSRISRSRPSFQTSIALRELNGQTPPASP